MMEHVAWLGRVLLEADQYHKDLFPLDTSDWVGTALVVIGLMIAASGGIGGGGLLVPIFVIVYGFKPIHAVALSNFTILGSSIMNMILNLSKRHPDVDRPLVDWDLIVMMEPLTMAGAIFGAFLGKMLPEIVLVIALVVLLGYTSKITLDKGIQLWKKETKEAENREKKTALAQAVEQKQADEEAEEASSLLGEKRDDDVDIELRNLLEAERHTPTHSVLWMNVMFVVVIILNLLKGGSGSRAFPSPIGVECGSTAYWFITFSIFAFVIGVSVYMRQLLLEKWRLKKRLRYKYAKGDIEWNEYNTIKYPVMCIFAGFCAGMFGIGGGIVKGPLMLEMGVHPLVAAATVAVMIFFTSIAATSSYVAFGILIWDYAWFLFVLGLFATLVGQYGVSYLVQKYKRVSLVSLSIGAVVSISTVLMAFQSIYSLLLAPTDVESSAESGSSICGTHK